MKKQLLLLLICFFAVNAYSQRTITGVVSSSDDGLPIIGASIVVKGTTQGTITDLDGNYSVNIPNDDAVLIFTYVGMAEQQIRVGSQSRIDVVMRSSSLEMEEVVVTAMGIKAEKKKLNFAVQSVNADDIALSKPTNFVDALQGRIAGLDVSGQGGSPSGKSQVLIRGISSVNGAQSNEPIFILDGIQVSGGASVAADINPNDIESVTVLKGAAAAALYGQDAANGAIMVTTKSARAGAIKVEASAMLQIENVVRTPKIQQMYVPGNQGVRNPRNNGGWGPMLEPGEKTYDNIDAFFQTGFFHKYDFSITGGTEKLNVLASANYSKHNGVVPKDYMDRWGLMLKANYNVNKRVSFSAMANILGNESRGFANGEMNHVYRWPINDDMSYYLEPNGDIRWRYIADRRHLSPVNPLFKRYEDDDKIENYRNILQGTMNVKIIKGLEFVGRIGYDYTNTERNKMEQRRWDTLWNDETNSYESSEELKYYGLYKWRDTFSSVVTGTALLTYEHDLTRDFKLNALVGADFRDQKSRAGEVEGYDFIVPGIYSLKNLNYIGKNELAFDHSQKRTYGFYGELKIDYKGLAHVGGTIRNDHSSTLSKGNRSYWYPSVSGGLVFSEIFDIASDAFPFGKLRGNWAKVGKDGIPKRLNSWFKEMPGFPDKGYIVDPVRGSNPGLKPEMMTSWEIGADLRFFENKTRLDVAYYRTSAADQIVEVRVSPASGYIQQVINDGTVRNQGMEITLEQTILRNKEFSWDLSLNIGYNRGKLLSLAGDTWYSSNSDGDIGTDIKATAAIGGGTLAIIGYDYDRTPDGKIICNESGLPTIAGEWTVIGNREPKATAGLSNRFTWKNWDLSFLFNFRLGGDVVNQTSRDLVETGQHKMLETYRNRQIVIDGVIEQEDGTYIKNTIPVTVDQTFFLNYYNNVSTNFVEDGSFIRLSHLTLGYDFSRYVKKIGVQGLRCSLTGRNLFLLTKYTGSDPQVNYTGSTGGSGTFGVDRNNIPNTRSFTFNINATF